MVLLKENISDLRQECMLNKEAPGRTLQSHPQCGSTTAATDLTAALHSPKVVEKKVQHAEPTKHDTSFRSTPKDSSNPGRDPLALRSLPRFIGMQGFVCLTHMSSLAKGESGEHRTLWL